MDTRGFLRRDYKINPPDEGSAHRIKELRIRPTRSLAPGDPVCLLEYKRNSLLRRGSSDTSYVAECAFDIEKYGEVEVLKVIARTGEEVSDEGSVLFSYAVPYTVANVLEPLLTSLVPDPTRLHSHSDIPSAKLSGAIEEYANGVYADRVLFLYDATAFGTGRTGFVITDSALYLHFDDASYEIRFNRIESWKQTEEVVPQEKGDPLLLKSLEISGNGETTAIPHTAGILDWANAGDFLDALRVLKEAGKTRDVDGPIAIQDLPEEASLAYVEAIIWLVHHDDGTIDVREFGELRLLMTQLDFRGDLRRRTIAMMDDAHELVLDRILARLNDTAPTGAGRPIAFSLVKDMVRVFEAANDENAANSPQVVEACRILDIDDEQLQVIQDAVNFDRQVFDGSVDSDELKKMAEGLASKAAGVGVPIAAIYMSGSVVGLSATGMTSGLAALGFGGLLGLSAMATGIGVAVLLGVGAYRGIQWALRGNKEEKRAQLRDLMLQAVLRNHQKAIAALGEDLAYFAQTIVDLSRDVLENKLKIERLGKEVTLFANALAEIKRRGQIYERELAAGDLAQTTTAEGRPSLAPPEGNAA